MSTLMECRDLYKKYGKKKALNGLSLELEGGKIIGLLGPNGSGKTTLIKILSGLLRQDGGIVRVGGNPIGIESKNIISYLPERTYFPTRMRVREAISFFQDFYQDFEVSRAEDMLNMLGIDKNMRFKEMSKGTREKVQLIMVMSRDARLYLLDEPIGGVDPAARDYILKTILGNYKEDASIIISTHLIADIENILDDIIFIREGQIVLHQMADNVRQEYGKSIDGVFREVFAC